MNRSFKSHWIFAASLLWSLTAAAAPQEISCLLREFDKGESLESTLKIAVSENPHGEIVPFKLSRVSELSGFVSVMRGYAVINVVQSPTGVATSSLGFLSAQGVIAQHQVIVPSEGTQPRGLQVVCQISR